jgi:hypothetical protein
VAEAFEILDIIDPRATRPIICRFVETAQPLLRQLAGPKGAVRP